MRTRETILYMKSLDLLYQNSTRSCIDEDSTVVMDLPPLLVLDISGLASDVYKNTDDNNEDSVTTMGRGRINPATTIAISMISPWESLVGIDTETNEGGSPVDDKGVVETGISPSIICVTNNKKISSSKFCHSA